MYGLKKIAIVGLARVSGVVLGYYFGRKVENMAIEKFEKEVEEIYCE
ncbi:MAG: hypothetical protein SOY42_04005 [Clostridium sp.]|nr:hypothetical protein [Clostridium sp.]